MHCRRACIAIVIFSSLAAGCSNSLQSMITDYNTNFTSVAKVTESPAPGESGFDASGMLAGMYEVSCKSVLSIPGPAGAAGYAWKAYQKQDGSDAAQLGTARQLNVYLPDSGIGAGVFNISLTVTDGAGKEYTDTALLWVTD